MKKKLIKIILALILFAFSMVIKFENVWINNILFVISYIIVGFEIIIKALRNIFRGKVFDENFLMTIATIGAFGNWRISRSCCCHVILPNWRIVSGLCN